MDNTVVTEEVVAGAAIPGKKPVWSRIVRPVVSIGLLVFILRGTDLGKLWQEIRNANFLFLILGLVVVVLALLVSAYKWGRLLTTQGVRVPFRTLFGSYLVGLFFNNFLPTNIGGDVVRIADVAKCTGKKAESVASVVGERLLAAFALGLTAVIGLVLSYNVSAIARWWVIGIVGVTLAIILLFAIEKVRSALGSRIRLPEKFSIGKWLGGVGASLGNCMRDKANVSYVVLLSMAFQLTVVLVSYFAFLALGAQTTISAGQLFIYCLAFIPIISALQMVPISISGFGVRESFYVYFFGAVGLSSEVAIASSLIFWALVALISLGGGLIFALRK